MSNWRVATASDRFPIINFLEANKNNISPSIADFPFEIPQLVDLLFKQGEILIAVEESRIIGLSAFTLGDATDDYQCKDFVVAYLDLFDPAYRNGSLYRGKIKLFIEWLVYKDIQVILAYAGSANKLANKINSRLGKLIGITMNNQNNLCNIYMGLTRDLARRFLGT